MDLQVAFKEWHVQNQPQEVGFPGKRYLVNATHYRLWWAPDVWSFEIDILSCKGVEKNLLFELMVVG
jgi:hypothetical protein